ncbi:MAG: FtsK/SpoIIIE domain-containing protein [Acidimicrobiales bacterium]
MLELDLVRDGPHGLVAGTTGSGKSELLRSLVAGLAVASPPDHLAFVLIDFKGGSAFDQCALLPHTVGLVTDLDAHLAQRALRCLEAELRRRERLLRDHGVADLQEYRRLPAEVEPLRG